jgi:hypothetical protein
VQSKVVLQPISGTGMAAVIDALAELGRYYDELDAWRAQEQLAAGQAETIEPARLTIPQNQDTREQPLSVGMS